MVDSLSELPRDGPRQKRAERQPQDDGKARYRRQQQEGAIERPRNLGPPFGQLLLLPLDVLIGFVAQRRGKGKQLVVQGERLLQLSALYQPDPLLLALLVLFLGIGDFLYETYPRIRT